MAEEGKYPYTVTCWDYLSGDTEPQIVDSFPTLEEAVEFAAGMLEDVGFDCVDERAILRPTFKRLAKTLRRGHGIIRHAGLDGYVVQISEEAVTLDR